MSLGLSKIFCKTPLYFANESRIIYKVFAPTKEITKEGISLDLKKGNTIDLKVVESSSLKIGNPRDDSLENHKFKALDVKNNFLNLTIDKRSSIKMEVSQTRRIDVDNDGTFDLSINLVNVRFDVASLLFKSLEEGVKVLESKEENNTITNSINETPKETKQEQTQNNEEATEKELSLNLEKSYDYKFILLIIFGVIILLLIIFFIVHKFR